MAQNNNEEELQFQSFEYSTNNETQGDLQTHLDLGNSSPFNEPSDTSTSNRGTSADENQQQGDGQKQAGTQAFWTVEFYQPYFDVDTIDVFKRMMGAFLFFKPDFLKNIKKKPDLWGPFWICVTMIVTLVITSNIGGMFNWAGIWQGLEEELRPGGHKNGTSSDIFNPPRTPTQWANDFSTVSVGSCVIFSYAVAVPTLLWLFMKWKDVPVTLLETISLYGYSFTVLLPFAMICIVSIDILRWGSVFLGILISLAFILLNIFMEVKNHLLGLDTLMLVVFFAYVIVCHLSFGLFIKVFFY